MIGRIGFGDDCYKYHSEWPQSKPPYAIHTVLVMTRALAVLYNFFTCNWSKKLSRHYSTPSTKWFISPSLIIKGCFRSAFQRLNVMCVAWQVTNLLHNIRKRSIPTVILIAGRSLSPFQVPACGLTSEWVARLLRAATPMPIVMSFVYSFALRMRRHLFISSSNRIIPYSGSTACMHRRRCRPFCSLPHAKNSLRW